MSFTVVLQYPFGRIDWQSVSAVQKMLDEKRMKNIQGRKESENEIQIR